MMYIIIFKTNLSTEDQSIHIQTILGKRQDIVMSSFDLDDCDRILRVVSTNPETEQICMLLSQAGFSCEALESFICQEQQY